MAEEDDFNELRAYVEQELGGQDLLDPDEFFGRAESVIGCLSCSSASLQHGIFIILKSMIEQQRNYSVDVCYSASFVLEDISDIDIYMFVEELWGPMVPRTADTFALRVQIIRKLMEYHQLHNDDHQKIVNLMSDDPELLQALEDFDDEAIHMISAELVSMKEKLWHLWDKIKDMYNCFIPLAVSTSDSWARFLVGLTDGLCSIIGRHPDALKVLLKELVTFYWAKFPELSIGYSFTDTYLIFKTYWKSSIKCCLKTCLEAKGSYTSDMKLCPVMVLSTLLNTQSREVLAYEVFSSEQEILPQDFWELFSDLTGNEQKCCCFIVRFLKEKNAFYCPCRRSLITDLRKRFSKIFKEFYDGSRNEIDIDTRLSMTEILEGIDSAAWHLTDLIFKMLEFIFRNVGETMTKLKNFEECIQLLLFEVTLASAVI